MNASFSCVLKCVLLVASLAALGIVHAGQSVPVVHPQWMTAFSYDDVPDDRIASTRTRTWVRLSNADTVLVTSAGNGLLLRRFGVDGSIRAAQWLVLADVSRDFSYVEVAADPRGDGIFVLAGSTDGVCQLLRTDDDFRLHWSIPAPAASAFPGQCRGLEVLTDGSAITLREGSLARVSDSGAVLWHVPSTDGDRSFLSAHGLAVDANHAIWLAGNGGESGNSAAVFRFDVDGTFLSSDYFLCGTCIASLALSIDVSPDEGAFVGGGSGSFQPGFFARYDTFGVRRVFTDTGIDVAYTRVEHDARGSIYALAVDSSSAVRRIDADSGEVLWSEPADDFVATDNGVLVTRLSDQGAVAVSLDDAGNEVWTRVLSTSATATVSHGVRAGAAVQLLVQDNVPLAFSCRRSPRLITLDDSGATTATLQACSMPGGAWLESIDALAGVGVLANLGTHLIAYFPDGGERWEVASCQRCENGSAGESRWTATALVGDGGAWTLLADSPSIIQPNGASTVQRIDSRGKVVASVAAAAAGMAPRILATLDDAVLLYAASWHGLIWQRIRTDGTQRPRQVYSIPVGSYHIDGARRLADGGVAATIKGDVICSVGCFNVYVGVLRLSADGRLLGRYEFPEYQSPVALTADGGALIAVEGGDGSPTLRRIDGDGHVAASYPLTGVPPEAQPTQLVGATDGHWLLRTQSRSTGVTSMWLIDAIGTVSASLPEAPYSNVLDTSDFGYIVSTLDETGAHVVLLDPVSLATRAQFYFGGSGDPLFDWGAPWPWRALGDGSLYGTMLTQRGGLQAFGLGRFTVPGAPPSNLIFRDAFD